MFNFILIQSCGLDSHILIQKSKHEHGLKLPCVMLCQQYKCYKVKITFVHESCGVLIKSKTLILYNSNNT